MKYVDRTGIKYSDKNFQINNGNTSDEEIIYQFGEAKDKYFYFADCAYPFTPLQDFAIGISNIHNKIFC